MNRVKIVFVDYLISANRQRVLCVHVLLAIVHRSHVVEDARIRAHHCVDNLAIDTSWALLRHNAHVVVMNNAAGNAHLRVPMNASSLFQQYAF